MRPMRPNPLIPIFVVMPVSLSLEVSSAAVRDHEQAADVTIVFEFMKLCYMPCGVCGFVLVL
jgi:hypothetical protein